MYRKSTDFWIHYDNFYKRMFDFPNQHLVFVLQTTERLELTKHSCGFVISYSFWTFHSRALNDFYIVCPQSRGFSICGVAKRSRNLFWEFITPVEIPQSSPEQPQHAKYFTRLNEIINSSTEFITSHTPPNICFTTSHHTTSSFS